MLGFMRHHAQIWVPGRCTHRLRAAWFAAWLVLCVDGPVCFAAPVAAVDAAGQRIQLLVPAQRIISLSPNATELLFAAGAGGKLVGVGRYSDYPAAAKQLPVVGDAFMLDVERILSLSPDLIVAWPGSKADAVLAPLRELGMPIYFSNPQRLADIPKELADLGRLAGTGAAAQRAIVAYRQQLAALRATYAGRAPFKVFYQIWARPLMTIGDQQLLDEALGLCGGVNIFAGLPEAAAVVSEEAVAGADPDVIMVVGHDGPAQLASWRRLPALRAVRTGRLLALDAPGLSRQAPRSLAGVDMLCRRLDALRR
ncbi:cobalamin-binding protein [Lasius niger]|uniref:Cobalamin-binding protein n=1 Tax=Lasius niger TaxID=67767 RepID=A0A0J7K1R9_LASNI|nr:cobalamin-binding protein [Lasius niger]